MTDAELVALQRAVIALQTALNNCASKQQLKQLYALRQQEIEEMKTRLDTIEEQLQILQRS
jgi:hypothetical protein